MVTTKSMPVILHTVLLAVVDHPRLVHLHLRAASPIGAVSNPASWYASGQARVVCKRQVVFTAVECPWKVWQMMAGHSTNSSQAVATVGLWKGSPGHVLFTLGAFAVLL